MRCTLALAIQYIAQREAGLKTDHARQPREFVLVQAVVILDSGYASHEDVVVLAALAPGYWWFAAALIIFGAAGLTFTNGTNSSIMQLSTEPAMRGRVMALRVGVALGGLSIGAPIVGWVANHFGPRWSLGLGATAGLTAALIAVYVLANRKEPLLTR
jgi:MFS family permease